MVFKYHFLLKKDPEEWLAPGLEQEIEWALCIRGFHILELNQPRVENVGGKKIQKVPKKQNLNLPHTSLHLHSIYIVLGIINNLKMI